MARQTRKRLGRVAVAFQFLFLAALLSLPWWMPDSHMRSAWGTAGETATAAALTSTANANATATANANATLTANAIASYTKTPTLTPTITPTPSPTLQGIPTPANGSGVAGPKCEPSHLCALKHGTVATAWPTCTSNSTSVTVTIPGIQKGDLFVPYPPIAGNPDLISAVIISNNTVTLFAHCSGDPGTLNTEFIWWDRTDPRGSRFDIPPDLTL